MNLRQKAMQGVGWSAIQNFGSQFITLGVFLVLARLLGPEVYGLVALANLFVDFILTFLDQGLGQAIIQRQEVSKEHLDTAFWTNVAMGVVLTALCIVGSGWAAAFFHEPALAPVICWLSPSFLLGSLNSVQQAVLTREFGFKSMATRSLIATGAGGVVGVGMAFAGCGVWSIVGQQLVSKTVGLVTLWQISSWRPGWAISLPHLREMLLFGVSVTGFNLSNFFNRRADSFLIGYFLGAVMLGYYAIASRIIQVMIQLLTTTTTQVALPTFAKLQREPERLRSGFYTVTQFTSVISFPAFLGVAALTPELVRVLFGNQWEPSIPVMQVLALLGIQQSVFLFNNTVLMAMGRPDWRLWINLLNAAAGILAIWLAYPWGIVAVAAAYVLRFYLLSPVHLWAVNRLITINLGTYCRQYVPALVGSTVMVFAILAIKLLLQNIVPPSVLLIVCGGAGAIVYLLTLRLNSPDLFERILGFTQVLSPFKKAASRAS